MLLNQSGSEIIGIDERKILMVILSADVSLSVRQIARVAGTSKDTTGRILKRYAATGMLILSEIGGSLVYQPNYLHAYWNPIQLLLKTSDSVFDEIKNRFKSYEKIGASVIIFGSVARGDSHLKSDIDTAVFYPDEKMTDEIQQSVHNSSTVKGISLLSGNLIQIIDIPYSELANMIDTNDPILRRMRKEHRWILGPELETLIRKVKHEYKNS